MGRYGTYSDDFYVNLNLNTEMDLPQSRETVLHFFEQLQKKYPRMKNFYGRERGEYVLEEDKEQGNYRWATVEPRRICSGYVNPTSVDEALDQHRHVLDGTDQSKPRSQLKNRPFDSGPTSVLFVLRCI